MKESGRQGNERKGKEKEVGVGEMKRRIRKKKEEKNVVDSAWMSNLEKNGKGHLRRKEEAY